MTATFASVRAARVHARQRFAMTTPQIHRVASPTSGNVSDIKGRFTAEQWQAEAYDHNEQIGELGYVTWQAGSTLAKGQLVVVEHDEFGRVVEPEKDDDGKPVIEGDRAKAERVLRNLRGPDGDHKAILAACGQHDWIAGEAILLASEIPDDGGTAWEIVSVREITKQSTGGGGRGKLVRQRTHRKATWVGDDTDTTIELDDDTYLTRYVRKSLEFSGDATSTLKRNATVCREIVLLDQLKDILIKSRLAAGIMIVPEEVTFPSDDDLDDVDAFLELVTEHVSAPIHDRSAPASLAPLIVRAPAEFIEKWRLFALTDGKLDLSSVQEARLDALRRLAGGIDLPLERMQGMGSTNHWNAAGLEADEIQRHIIPLGERIARWLTTAYLRRCLVVLEDMSDEDASRFSLEYDASELLTRVDTATSADVLHAEGLISDEARIRAHGFDPDEVRPSPEERQRRMLERLSIVPNANNRVLVAGLIDPEIVGVPQDIWDEWLTIPATTEVIAGNPDDEPAPQVVEPARPATPAAGEPNVDRAMQDEATMAVLERIRTRGHDALSDSLRKAANRVMTNERKLTASTRTLIEQIPRTGPRKPEVLPLLSPGDWETLNLRPADLVNGSFSEFEQQAFVWLRDMLASWGRADADAAATATAVALRGKLEAMAEGAFTRSLSRDPVTGMTVPLQLVVDTVGAGVRM